jgi:predicted permease
MSNAAFNAWYSDPSLIEAIGGWRIVTTTWIPSGGEPSRVQTAAVTPSLFPVLRAQPRLGRVFVEDDGRPGGNFPSKDVVILSFPLWRDQLGGRDDVIGTAINLGGRPHTIVGVMPADFAFPDRTVKAWTPWAVPSVLAEGGGRRMSIFAAMARLRPGVTPEQAAAEATARARTAPDPGLAAVAMFGGSGAPEVGVVPAVEMMTTEVRPALWMMLAGVVLLLVTATANVASLQLARATTRRREFAIRAAIGAPVARVARQLAVESVALGIAGGLAGFAFAAAVTRLLPSVLPADFPRMDDIGIEVRTVVFAAGISLVSGLLCSLLPAVHARRLDLVGDLADGPAAGGFVRSPGMRARTAIMAAQVSVACVLLVGAALLTRSFAAMLAADRGYDPRNLLTARLPLPPDFPAERRTEILEAVKTRMQAVPGVATVAYGNALPLVTSGGFRAFKMRSPVSSGAEVDVNAMQRVVNPDYFDALALRVISGRAITDQDTMTSRQVIVVNRSFASTYLGPQPLGAIVPNLGMCRGDNDRWEVVGVIDDMRQGAVLDPPQPEIFMPYAQVGCAGAVSEPILVVRTHDDPIDHAAMLRQVLRQEAPSLALDSVMTMDERVMLTLSRPRLYAVVIAGLAAFALVIAGVGLFGVVSYGVAQRAREIALRMALGARPADVFRVLLRQIAIVSAAGIGVGLALAYGSTRWLTTVLYGVAPHDPLSFVVVPALLGVVILVATVVPAARAMRLDPVRVLRTT